MNFRAAILTANVATAAAAAMVEDIVLDKAVVWVEEARAGTVAM